MPPKSFQRRMGGGPDSPAGAVFRME